MLYLDNNAEIRDLFREVDGVSQHGLDELFDQDVVEGKRSFADAIIEAGINNMVKKRTIVETGCRRAQAKLNSSLLW